MAAKRKKPKKIKRPKGHIPEYYWPVGPDAPKRPTHWQRMPTPVPCDVCDRTHNDYGSQAVTAAGGIQGGIAYIKCRVCGHESKMPVAE